MARTASVIAATWCALALVTTGCGLFDDSPPGTLAFPEEVDIAYGGDEGCNGTSELDDACGGSQTLDIYRGEGDGPRPVALWVHGGGFVGGDKGVGVSDDFQTLLDDGWDIVAINYRVSTEEGENRWPVPLQDVKQAVRWVKANAEDNDWDPDRVAAIGHSAGGNLVGMLATTANVAELEPADLPDDLAEVDSSIIAAIAVKPVTDLDLYSQSPFGETVATYLGCIDCPDLIAAGSVQTHVDGDSAPILGIYGVDDPFAAPDQGRILREAYQAAGIADRFELIVVDDGPRDERGHDPGVDRFIDRITQFLEAAAGGNGERVD
jgi:acetyl esterase/lipase